MADTIHVVAAIIERDGRIFCARRRSDDEPTAGDTNVAATSANATPQATGAYAALFDPPAPAAKDPSELPGWEFPGGKVEPGETPEAALAREIREELGCNLQTMWFLDTVEHDYPSFHLSMDCYVCTLADGEEPQLAEHADSRWLAHHEVMDVNWLDADRSLVLSLGVAWEEIFSTARL